MNRYFYICNNLEDVSHVEEQLLSAGFSPLQLHVLSNDDAGTEKHHLHGVDSLSKQDIFRSSMIGALLGLVAGAIILAIASMLGVSGDAWAPVLFLAICVFGFCTWEGGLFGIQIKNYEFMRFEPSLDSGQHVFFADVNEPQREPFLKVLDNYPNMHDAGSGKAESEWKFNLRESARRFVRWAP